MNRSIPAARGHFFRHFAMRRTHVRRRKHVCRRAGRGFTLIEMLVALAITLIMMGAVVTLFGVISESVAHSRSAIEMADRLRSARNRLQLDLQGHTATLRPPLRPEWDEGYFEIIEGERTDDVNGIEDGILGNADDHLRLFGDNDDVLMFTTRSRGAPFVGRFTTGGVATVIESPVAEVVYFLRPDGPIIDAAAGVRLFTLHRRVLLVAPQLTPFSSDATDAYYEDFDLSARVVSGQRVANTLGDLTKRENRFSHNATTFPHVLNPVTAYTTRIGDDVLLNNVLAFDVQAFDAEAEVRVSGNVALEPSDPGWGAGTATTQTGAYVDLGYLTGTNSQFSEIPQAKSQLTARPFVYDTWSLHYENDGLDKNGDPITAGNPGDLGTDGLDLDDAGNSNGIVDDVTEFDTLPPYAVPLRGIRVRIRVYEPSSKAVREAVVVQNFEE